MPTHPEYQTHLCRIPVRTFCPAIGIEALRNCCALGVAVDAKCCRMDTVRRRLQSSSAMFPVPPTAQPAATVSNGGVSKSPLSGSLALSLLTDTASTRVSAMELPVPTSVNCKVVEVSVAVQSERVVMKRYRFGSKVWATGGVTVWSIIDPATDRSQRAIVTLNLEYRRYQCRILACSFAQES